jgi:hypothetical protein
MWFFYLWERVCRAVIGILSNQPEDALRARVSKLIAEAIATYNRREDLTKFVSDDATFYFHRCGSAIQVIINFRFTSDDKPDDGSIQMAQGQTNSFYGTGPSWLRWFHDARFVENLIDEFSDLYAMCEHMRADNKTPDFSFEVTLGNDPGGRSSP